MRYLPILFAVIVLNASPAPAAELPPAVARANECSLKLADRYSAMTTEPAETIATAAIAGCEDKWQLILNEADRQRFGAEAVQAYIIESEQLAKTFLVRAVIEMRLIRLQHGRPPAAAQ